MLNISKVIPREVSWDTPAMERCSPGVWHRLDKLLCPQEYKVGDDSEDGQRRLLDRLDGHSHEI